MGSLSEPLPSGPFPVLVRESLGKYRNVPAEILNSLHSTAASDTTVQALKNLVSSLNTAGYAREANAIDHVADLCLNPKQLGGLGLGLDATITGDTASEVIFLICAWLESLNSDDRTARKPTEVLTSRPPGRPPMNLTEKIFAIHDSDSKGFVTVGDTIRARVDWIMASEASWSSMEDTYNQLGGPGIFRNDRFWLAGDHVVDPRVNAVPKIKRLIDSAERAKRNFKMTEYQGMNYTIMHTEFYRERAQPGMLIIGSDSHTCSSGAVGCLAIGLGASDVTMALVTGEIWFRVPEVININFVGQPARGIGGKDVILYVLQQLKRNTVAADRVVEYTGPGLSFLSPDARFAISNMTTEFGGITGVFAPDHITHNFIQTRKQPRHKNFGNYLRPDEDASYAATYTIDLSKAESSVAKYPNPDDVVPVSAMAGEKLDGCFIGACTTTEEDIIMAGLVLEQGLTAGKVPKEGGKRKLVPGSMPIMDRLQTSGMADVYRSAGFDIGLPGCSYCVGMSADQASEGEHWLSSQNRNFENRMGKGSIGNLASAATVAASSFDMIITDPRELMDKVDEERFASLKGRGSLSKKAMEMPQYVEPPASEVESAAPVAQEAEVTVPSTDVAAAAVSTESGSAPLEKSIKGKINKLGDFIDTDALAPAQILITARTDQELGEHCLEFTHPEFRQRVKDGCDVVVAGKAFGCGSSRQQAVNALLGCGVKCVIAESFAFIYSRNQPSLGLLGISMQDADFHSMAQDGADIEIDIQRNVVRVADREFSFQLSPMEKQLRELGGITAAFQKYGKRLFESLCQEGAPVPQHRLGSGSAGLQLDETAVGRKEGLSW